MLGMRCEILTVTGAGSFYLIGQHDPVNLNHDWRHGDILAGGPFDTPEDARSYMQRCHGACEPIVASDIHIEDLIQDTLLSASLERALGQPVQPIEHHPDDMHFSI